MRCILLFLLSLGCLEAAQNVCRDLPTVPKTEALIEEVLLVGANTRPTVTITDIQFLCAASGMSRGNVYVSVLANYSCEGSHLCPGSMDLSQFDFQCLGGVWRASILASTANVKRNNPVANFTTPMRTDCSICINPSVVAGSDPLTHCRGNDLAS